MDNIASKILSKLEINGNINIFRYIRANHTCALKIFLSLGKDKRLNSFPATTRR